MNLNKASLKGWEDSYIHKHACETKIMYVGETELNNDKWYVTAQRMGTWAQARAVQNGFDSQVNIFLVFKLEK